MEKSRSPWDDMDDADIDWLETMDNPAAYGRASISTLPKWQKHDPQTYGFLNPKQREHSKAVCPRCRDLLDRDDAFTKVNPMSDTCVRCRGIDEFEKVSSLAGDGGWSPTAALAAKRQYETAFGIIVNIFNLTNPRQSDFVKALPTQAKTDIFACPQSHMECHWIHEGDQKDVVAFRCNQSTPARRLEGDHGGEHQAVLRGHAGVHVR